MERSVSLFSPAKVNLFLAITDRRDDGFHNLVSVVAPLTWGDDLGADWRDQPGFSLTCERPDVPLDSSNLILRAGELYAQANPAWRGGAHFRLTKRIPLGAGLGGGSSNAVAALRLLNQLSPEPLTKEALVPLAAQLGSDCVLFLRAEPLIMRGRGEQIESLPAAARDALRGQRLLLFKPDFGINTGWAYQQMVQHAPASYCPRDRAEAHLARWSAQPAELANLLFNNMETAAFGKFVALPVLLAWLRERHGLLTGMSGSGSACFAVLPEGFDPTPVVRLIHEAWGEACFVAEAKIP